jgi:diguanylate cyclase (GGDEF)-like protein/putative nucleotidyltransferase with HDIG domain
MRQMPWAARVYLYCLYAIGAVAFVWLIISYDGPITSSDWALAGGLAMVSAICQVFLVARTSTTGQRSDHLTLAPLFAALVLLPRPLLAPLIVLTFLPEWYFHRRSWFGQVFNIAAFLLASSLALLSFWAITGVYRLPTVGALSAQGWLGVLALIVVFELSQAMLLAVILKLARGQSLRKSGLFAVDSLLLEFTLICVGLCFAVAWQISPIYGLAAGMPLLLIFQALHVPNLREEASTDPKTGLANMRHFNALLERELDRVSRSGQPLSLLVCDLDYLRNINNTYGHQAGDIVLCGIAEIIRSTIRANDLGARYGGEEFLVMLPDTDSNEAQIVAERIRETLEQSGFPYHGTADPLRATISIGVATYPYDGRTAESLLREADLAVYKAKADGRNRVVVAGRETRVLASDWAREHLLPSAVDAGMETSAAPRPLWNFIKQATSSSPVVRQDPVAPKPPAVQPQRRKQDRQRDKMMPWIWAFVGIQAALALLSILPGISFDVSWTTLLLLCALVVAAEQFAIDISGRGKLSVSVVLILGAAFSYHETGILLTALAAALSLTVKSRSPLHRALFNFSTVVLSARGADLVVTALVGPAITAAPITTTILPAALAGLVYYAINQALLCAVRGIHENRRPWDIWYTDYRWLWPHFVVLGALGLIVALSYRDYGPVGVLALMAPVAMMHVAFAQYAGRTRVYVDELQQLNVRLTDSYEATLQALTRALDTRDEETEEHSQRVKRYTELLARRLQISEADVHDMARGALLHDIGKIGVPDAILLKPGAFTEAEHALMRNHPEIGYRMIAHIPFLARAALVVLHHHERYDGTGYPSGLAREYIPLGARIFAIVDTFDAMTTDRPYRRALPIEAARKEILRCRGTQFDPRLVDTFLAIPDADLLEARDGGNSHESRVTLQLQDQLEVLAN